MDISLEKAHNGKQKNEELDALTLHQGNVNQNYSEISPHSCQHIYYKNTNDSALMENRMEAPQNSLTQLPHL